MSNPKNVVKNETSEHSALYNYIAEESARFQLKGVLCVALLIMAVKTLADNVRTYGGHAISVKQGGKKGSAPATYAKNIADGLTNAMSTHFHDVAKESKDILPTLDYDTNGKASLQVIDVKDTNGVYTFTQGSQLRRLRAAFMTLCGDWQPLHDNAQSPAVKEFVEAYGEKVKGKNIGFSVRYAIEFLNREDAAMMLETVASAKSEVIEALAKASGKADEGESASEGEGTSEAKTESEVKYSPQVDALLKTVAKLKEVIIKVAQNATVDECEAWQDAITKMIVSIDVDGGEVAAPEVETAEAPAEAQQA